MGYYLGAMRKTPKIPRTPRQIVLERDFLEMQQLAKESSIIEFGATGTPPDKYRIIFHGGCLVQEEPAERYGKYLKPSKSGKIVLGNLQELEVSLGMEYPRQLPNVRWITEIVHPNISNAGGVCFGTFATQWSSTMHLDDLVEILWDYCRLKTLNPSHAGYGGWPVKWEELAQKFFPGGEGVDERCLRDKLVGKNKGSSMIAPPETAGDIVIFPDDPDRC